MSDYAKQLAAHPRWQYQPGMVTMTGHIVIEDDDGPFVWLTYGGQMSCLHKIDADECVPDIEHPATQGWMMAMLLEVLGDSLAIYRNRDGKHRMTWRRRSDGGRTVVAHERLGPALTAALLRAWGEL